MWDGKHDHIVWYNMHVHNLAPSFVCSAMTSCLGSSVDMVGGGSHRARLRWVYLCVFISPAKSRVSFGGGGGGEYCHALLCNCSLVLWKLQAKLPTAV